MARSIARLATLSALALTLSGPAGAVTVVTSPLQEFNRTQILQVSSFRQEARLTRLNAHAGFWSLLEIASPEGSVTAHLEAVVPGTQIALYEKGLLLSLPALPDVPSYQCELFGTAKAALVPRTCGEILRGEDLVSAEPLFPVAPELRDARGAFVPICDGLLYVRNQVQGRQSLKETVANGSREWFGAWGNAFVETVKEVTAPAPEAAQTGDRVDNAALAGSDRPRPALLKAGTGQVLAAGHQLGIKTREPVTYGYWSASALHAGVYASLLDPELIAPEVMSSYAKGRIQVRPLQDREANALVYLAAFDLSQFDFNYALGTDYPEVGWSPRVARGSFADASLPGPDGFEDSRPLARAGVVPPHLRTSVEATFVGGFKRSHGAFKYGPLSKVNHGSHYGFMEQGVVFSKLQPGLATFSIGVDGQVDLLTWPDAPRSAELSAQLRHARQNGVPLVDGVDESGMSVPGYYVGRGDGSWSGDANGDPISQRAGACIQESGGKRYLLYAYFSGASPNLMARVFQAYRCRYAMLLDMNAYEHTFFALSSFDPASGAVSREYLHTGMKGAEPRKALRFLDSSDNRDFFYVTRRK